MRHLLREIAETISALAQIAAHILITPFVGARRLCWGASSGEAAASLPGDELVPHPRWTSTHGITIDATQDAVWPWLVQIGQGRGGFYTYEALENLVGCQVRNAERIFPELQKLEVGDSIRIHPSAPALRVEVVEPPRTLVLYGGPEDRPVDGQVAATWQFQLRGCADGSTRLLTRGRNDYGPGLLDRLFYGRFLLEPINFVMSRRMLAGIKERAESSRAGVLIPNDTPARMSS